MSTTVYSACKKCRKPLLLPAAPLVHAGRPSGSYGFCKGCRTSIARCSIWYAVLSLPPTRSHTIPVSHLPVRALMYQCPVCMHGGHQDCYRLYYTRRPPDRAAPQVLPTLHRAGRSLDVVHLGLSLGPAANPTPAPAPNPNADANQGPGSNPASASNPSSSGAQPASGPPRARALSRANSTATTCDGESDDGGEGGEGEGGMAGSYGSASARGFGPASASGSVLGRLCAAGCGHHCWAVNAAGK